MAQGGSGGIRQFIGLSGGEEVKQAFKSFGDVGEKAFRDISRAAEASAGNVAAFGRSVKTAETAIGGLSRTVSGAVAGLGSVKGAFAALAGAQGIRTGMQAIGDVHKGIDELNKTAAGTGFKPETVKTIEEIFGDVGVNVDTTRQALSSFNDVVSEARQKLIGTGDAAKEAATGVNVMRGGVASLGDGMVQVFRGGVKPVDDMSNGVLALTAAMRDIGKSFDIRQFKTQEDRFKGIASALKELNAQKPELAAQIGKDIFKRPWAEIAKGIFAIGEAWDKTQKELTATGRMPTPEDTKRADEYRAAWDAIGDSMEAAYKKAAAASHNSNIAMLNSADQLIQKAGDLNVAFEQFTQTTGAPLGGNLAANTVREFDALGTFFSTTLPGWANTTFADLTQGFADLGAAFSEAFSIAFANIKTAGSDLVSWLSSQISSLSSSLSALLGQASSAPGGNLEGYASGGMVRGPGTGTSDSVLARLSAGEFVMKTRAVDHWGPQFLHALNSLRNPFGFAEGGLVGLGSSLMPPSAPGFAEGGLAAVAAGGTPVHLHLGGHSFALSGPESVVNSLVVEAHRHKIRSTGTKPSWFGGTPGGR